MSLCKQIGDNERARRRRRRSEPGASATGRATGPLADARGSERGCRTSAARRLSRPRTRRYPLRNTLLLIAGLASIGLGPGGARQASASASEAPQPNPPAPVYVQRGDAVEARYRSYIATLEMYHEKLRTALRSEAPDLAKRLAGEPAKPIPYGYQLAPRLVADATPGPRTRPASNSYSWRRTDEFIDGQLARLAGAEKKLEETSKLLPAERRPGYEPMVGDYGELAENQRRIDQHVQYNRFWQKTIAGDRPRFDRSTLFHDAVVEREKILDELQRADLAPEQRVRVEAREKELYRQIAQEKEGFSAPPFLDLKRPNRRLWIVRVPLYSDIQDKQFLREAKKAIEAVWRFKDEEVEFRVSVDYRIVSSEKLYRPDPAPAAGTHLDLDSHVKRFPNNGAVLTTGANSTYAISGRYIALGPGEIARNVLAHEFGHILGFNDGYFRGYRDGGADGFEVLEIVPDPDDLMCNPGGGKVQRAHFEKLVAALQSRFQRTGSGSVKK